MEERTPSLTFLKNYATNRGINSRLGQPRLTYSGSSIQVKVLVAKDDEQTRLLSSSGL